MNRSTRRRQAMRVVSDAIKQRNHGLQKPTWGLGWVFTNQVGTIMVGNNAFTLWDRRLNDARP